MSKTFAADELDQFTGTETWKRHGLLPSILYTEGVAYLAERAGAYWLIDDIAIANGIRDDETAAIQKEEFQVWKLQRDPEGHGAWLTVQDGNYREIYRKRIEFTDFPLSEIVLWFTDHVIMLPSEY